MALNSIDGTGTPGLTVKLTGDVSGTERSAGRPVEHSR